MTLGLNREGTGQKYTYYSYIGIIMKMIAMLINKDNNK